jgi:Holliday junction DNA helicase RuvA
VYTYVDMIARIHGEVIAKNRSSVVIDVHGVGYEIIVSEPDFGKCQISEPMTLHTHFHVRENSQELYGFSSLEAKDLFEMLIDVSGVGPKSAIAIVSLGSVGNIRSAIAGGNITYLSAASGVGKRSAERICVELKDKIGLAGGGQVDLTSGINEKDEALAALIQLGYSRTQVIEALGKVDMNAKLENRIRQALKELGR